MAKNVFVAFIDGFRRRRRHHCVGQFMLSTLKLCRANYVGQIMLGIMLKYILGPWRPWETPFSRETVHHGVDLGERSEPERIYGQIH